MVWRGSKVQHLWNVDANKAKVKKIFDPNNGTAALGKWFAEKPLDYIKVRYCIRVVRSMAFYVNFSVLQGMGFLFRPSITGPCHHCWQCAITSIQPTPGTLGFGGKAWI